MIGLVYKKPLWAVYGTAKVKDIKEKGLIKASMEELSNEFNKSKQTKKN